MRVIFLTCERSCRTGLAGVGNYTSGRAGGWTIIFPHRVVRRVLEQLSEEVVDYSDLEKAALQLGHDVDLYAYQSDCVLHYTQTAGCVL